jgi:putative oxidoreductase
MQLWFQYPTKSVNAIKFLNILPFTKDHSKQVWITKRINISLALITQKQIKLHLRQTVGMKRILSTTYTEGLFNLGTFLLRACLGILMFVNHGLPKIFHFSEFEKNFFNFLHLGSSFSLVLSIIAEVFASGLLVLGLFSRIAAILLLIDLGVAIFMVHSGQPVIRYEGAVLFFAGFLMILLVGPGKFSVDAFAGK